MFFYLTFVANEVVGLEFETLEAPNEDQAVKMVESNDDYLAAYLHNDKGELVGKWIFG